MSVDLGLISAIRAAVVAAPENLTLRAHLAELLKQAGDAAACLQECMTILTAEPDHLQALTLAAWSAEQVGDAQRAQRYRRLATALAGDAPVAAPVPVAQPAQSPSQKNSGATVHTLPTAGRAVEGSGDRTPRIAGATPEDDANVVRLRAIAGGGGDEAQYERPKIRMSDVAGMHHVKERLELAFLGPLKNPQVRRLYGKSLRGGLLLYGPPGCGKTYIARATAGELGAAFFSAGLSDVLDMYLGESERKLHELFETARRHTPCVLFFDEIDALGHKRSQLARGAGRTIVNQLLDELDNVGKDNEGLFVLAATNHPWDVDTALRRPGRFDRTLLVTPPDESARDAILRYHMEERPQNGIDFAWLVRKTARFSGADLAHLCESATEFAMADAVRSGHARPISMADMKQALKSIKPSTETWIYTARNYAQYSNEGGAYDDLLEWMRSAGK